MPNIETSQESIFGMPMLRHTLEHISKKIEINQLKNGDARDNGEQMFNLSGSSKIKKSFSLVIAILFIFNTLSQAAPVEQENLRPLATGQKREVPARQESEALKVGTFEDLHSRALEAITVALDYSLLDHPQFQAWMEIQEALDEPATPVGIDEVGIDARRDSYKMTSSILSKLEPGKGLMDGYVTFRLTKGGKIIVHFKIPGADYVRVYSLDKKGKLVKTDQFGQLIIMGLGQLTNLEEAVRDFLRSRVGQQPGAPEDRISTTQVEMHSLLQQLLSARDIPLYTGMRGKGWYEKSKHQIAQEIREKGLGTLCATEILRQIEEFAAQIEADKLDISADDSVDIYEIMKNLGISLGVLGVDAVGTLPIIKVRFSKTHIRLKEVLQNYPELKQRTSINETTHLIAFLRSLIIVYERLGPYVREDDIPASLFEIIEDGEDIRVASWLGESPRQLAINAATAVGPSAVSGLHQLFLKGDYSVKSTVTQICSQMGPAGIPILVRGLTDDEVGHLAVRALINSGWEMQMMACTYSPEIIPTLKRLTESYKEAIGKLESRKAAGVAGVQHLSDKKAVLADIELLLNKIEAVKAEGSVSNLLELLSRKSLDEKYKAQLAFLLGEIGSPRASSEVIALTRLGNEAKEPYLVEQIAVAIRKIKGLQDGFSSEPRPKSSSSGKLVQVEDLTFKVSSEKLQKIKDANPDLAEDLSNLIGVISGPKPPSERLAEIEKSISETGPNPSLIRLKQLLPSLIKIAVFGDVYLALVKDDISKKEVPLLIRKEGDGYKTTVILDMLPIDVMRIINKLSGEGPKRIKKFVDGRPTKPTQPIVTRFTPWASFYFQLRNSGVQPPEIGIASLSSLFTIYLSEPLPPKFKIGEIPVTTNDLKSFPRQREYYKPINFNELNLMEDYWLRLEDMFTPRALKELKNVHSKLRGLRFHEEIRNLNIDLMRWILREWPEYKFITPSITLCNIFFKRKDGSDYYTRAEVVLAVSKENRLVPVLVGVEGYTLPGSIKEEPNVTGPTLMTHLSKEAIYEILKTLPEGSVEHCVWSAYARQQGVGVAPKSSSAGLIDCAELNLLAHPVDWTSSYTDKLISQFQELETELNRAGMDSLTLLNEVIEEKRFDKIISKIGPFEYEGMSLFLLLVEDEDIYKIIAVEPQLVNCVFYSVDIKEPFKYEELVSSHLDELLDEDAKDIWRNYFNLLKGQMGTKTYPKSSSAGVAAIELTDGTNIPVKTTPEDYKQLIEMGLMDELIILRRKLAEMIGARKLVRPEYWLELRSLGLVELNIYSLKFLGDKKSDTFPAPRIYGIQTITGIGLVISPDSQLSELMEVEEAVELDNAYTGIIAPKASSAGLCNCVELKDLDLTELYFELREELESLQEGIDKQLQGLLPFRDRLQQSHILGAIGKKNLMRIPLATGPFMYGEKRVFLILGRGMNTYRIIAIDSEDLKYLKVDITDKNSFRRAIKDFLEELEQKQGHNLAAQRQLELFGRWSALWNKTVGEQVVRPDSAIINLQHSIKCLGEIAQSA